MKEVWILIYENYLSAKDNDVKEDFRDSSSGYTVLGVFDDITLAEKAVKKAIKDFDIEYDNRIRLAQKEEYNFSHTVEDYDIVLDMVFKELHNIKLRKMAVNEQD